MSKFEKERKKLEQEKFQSILNQLLREEDNKYCADCDAKGPRWASWNLGLFLCIRCAGIHRKLGVHISKVKSVNLDSWTAQQTAHMQCIGNSVARGVYECNIPEHFRRPQTDSALEAFIRAKYDQKRYILKDWIPPQIDPSQYPSLDANEAARVEKTAGGVKSSKPAGTGYKKTKSAANTGAGDIGMIAPPPESKTVTGDKKEVISGGKTEVNGTKSPTDSNSKPSAIEDLLGLSPAPVLASNGPSTQQAPIPSTVAHTGALNDIMGLNDAFSGMAVNHQPPASSATNDLQLLQNSNVMGDTAASLTSPESTEITTNPTSQQMSSGPKSTIDILALYGSSSTTTSHTQSQAHNNQMNCLN